jgi:haloalkane dehalogenase
MTMSAGLANPADVFPHIIEGTEPQLEGAAAKMYEAYIAPVKGLSDAAYNGMRRFPLSIPLDSYDNGNAAAQTLHYKILLGWKKPVYFVWGCSDDVFNEAWGRQWASQMNASFDAIPDAGHFLQNTHGSEVAAFVLGRIGKE